MVIFFARTLGVHYVWLIGHPEIDAPRGLPL